MDIGPNSTGNRFRASRVALLSSLIGKSLGRGADCRILDVGGTYAFWHTWKHAFDWSKTTVTCVNLDPTHAADGRDETNVRMVRGDACNLPMFEDNAFDIVFSNSVIEHVGHWREMKAMAHEVRRLAPTYLLQTPNFWFPIEPHARTPFLHWLPEPLGRRVVMARKCGYWDRAANISEAMETLQSAHLLDYGQMTALFPDAKLIREKFYGLTKSLIAVRDGT